MDSFIEKWYNIEWQRVYGGDSLDVLISVVESSDGAYVFWGILILFPVMLLLIMDFMILVTQNRLL